jgi:hypothetical protein
MEHYYKSQLNANPLLTPSLPPTNNNSVLSDFDHHHLTLLLGQKGEGWLGELCRYLKDMPADVTKDTDIVEWWQMHSWCRYTWYYPFLTTCRITDYITPPYDVLRSTSLHAQHPLFLANTSFLVVARSQ